MPPAPSTRLLAQVHHRRLGALVGAQQLCKVGAHGRGLAPQLQQLGGIAGAAAPRQTSSPRLEVGLLRLAGGRAAIGTGRDMGSECPKNAPPAASPGAAAGGWRG